ncbi:MAG: class I SAM-dependent methyltransferase [Chloroflexi bacterium]|nr:class I SAM-dependent methyltransferase [Chloroflexota bacterium]
MAFEDIQIVAGVREIMTVTADPNAIETAVLHELMDFTGRRVLEIGCGDGRMTWQYAGQAASVIAIDPNQEAIASAIKQRPAELSERVEFRVSGIEDFAGAPGDSTFDVVLFTRSLC